MPIRRNEAVGRALEILVIEGNLQEARQVLEGLRQSDVLCRVSLVANAEEALEFLHRRNRFRHAPRPDVIFMAMRLPDRDGRDLLAEIKVVDRLCRIPVVVLGEGHADQEAIRGNGWAVQGFLAKPVEAGQLAQLIRALRRDLLTDLLVTYPG